MYDALEHAAETKENGDVVFTGLITKAFETTGLPSPYYGKIMSYLQDMGAITKLRTGARNADSVVALHFRPTEEHFLSLDRRAVGEKRAVADMIRDNQIKELQGKVDDLEGRLKKFEERT